MLVHLLNVKLPNMTLNYYPQLTPITSPWMHNLVENKERLGSLFAQYGSPLNILNMEPFAANYEAYQTVFETHNVHYHVFYARKANKCRAFVREADRLGFGLDTASYEELEQCLQMGCDPKNLVLTAAVKNEHLIRYALKNDVLIVLDNEDECKLADSVAAKMGKVPIVAVRISGFRFKGEKLYSRFGFDIEKVEEFIVQQISSDHTYRNLSFGGFHFHLDGYSIEQRAAGLIQTLRLAKTLKNKGINTSFIDIGGGLLTSYLSSGNEWQKFWEELKKALRGKRKAITFGNNSLGLKTYGDEVNGKPHVYQYYNETPKNKFLDFILSSKDEKGTTAASLLNELEIEVRIEPGRSLLDQSGMTLAKVAHRKQDQRGDWLVGLEMNRSQLFSSSDDFLVDPFYISMQSSDHAKESEAVYFTGSYCLEQDIILKRKITLPKLPEVGDIIAFPNTAGYMMHFYETRSHLHPFSTNLIMDRNSSQEFTPDRYI